MYLRTLSTQPVVNIENLFTLSELSNDEINIKKLIDHKENTTTIIIKDYDTSTKIDMEV
jgi:hypothetical protein